jgi:hypothetical protein
MTITMAFAVNSAISQEPTIDDTPIRLYALGADERAEWTLQTEEQATEKARRYLGLPDDAPQPEPAKLVILDADNTPYLSEIITGRPIWHIVIKDWKIELKSFPEREDSYVRTFDVFLDPQTGQLLKIVSRWPDGVPPIPPEPGAASYTDQMKRAGNERYHGFPAELPSATFVDALDGVLTGGGNLLGCQQIVGQYVIWSMMGKAPKPMWIISLRGGAQWHSHGPPGATRVAMNHLRHKVDPTTGKSINASSTPNPDE